MPDRNRNANVVNFPKRQGAAGVGALTVPTLKRGARGPFVETLQTALTAAHFGVTVDGQFGPETENAVKSFQAAYGLKPDGIAGQSTWDQLRQATGITIPNVDQEGTEVVFDEGEVIVGGAAAQAPSFMDVFNSWPNWQKALVVAGGFAAIGGIIVFVFNVMEDSQRTFTVGTYAEPVKEVNPKPCKPARTPPGAEALEDAEIITA